MAKKSKTAKKTKTRKTVAKATRKSPARKSAAKAASSKKKTSSAFALTSLAPSLTVNDINQSLTWYCDVLGFAVGQRWENAGTLRGAELNAGKTTVYLSQEDGAQGDRVKGAGFRLYWYTDQNIDQIATGIKNRGGTLASEPKDEWGVRAFSLVDPTGYKITVSSNR